MYPNRTSTSGMAGRISDLSWVENEAPGWACADGGNSFSTTLKTTITTMPETNSGTVAAELPVSVMIRSSGRPAWMAATTPPRMPSGMITMSASAASLAEFTRAVTSSGSTGDWYWYDSPMLPRAMPEIQLQY